MDASGSSSRLRAAFDPEQFRREAHELADLLADYLEGALDRRSPAVLPWREPEQQLTHTPAIAEGAGPRPPEIARDLLERAFHLHDPRTLGHQDGLPVPAAALAGLLISLLNNDPSVYETGPAVVPIELRVLRWMCDELGLPAGAGGILTSGGSLGNLTALLAARQAKAGYDAWARGHRAAPEDLCILVSEHAHYCVGRAVRMMGWGDEGVATVGVDARYRLDPRDLPAALERARRGGRRPIAVVASACTTATGVYDPLPEIADFCAAHDLWLHVDGAHGASAALSPRYRHLVAGIDRADSVVWDCHKMLMMPALLTGVLFRERRRSYETFRQEATYLFEERPDEEWYNPGNRTVECTRPGMAVLLYTSLRAHGAGLFRDYVTRCFDAARELAARVRAADDFELAMEPEANIVCFRYAPAGAADLDALQERVRRRVVDGGGYYIVSADLDDGQYLRCTLMNPFTDEGDLVGLLETIRKEAAAPQARAAAGSGGAEEA